MAVEAHEGARRHDRGCGGRRRGRRHAGTAHRPRHAGHSGSGTIHRCRTDHGDARGSWRRRRGRRPDRRPRRSGHSGVRSEALRRSRQEWRICSPSIATRRGDRQRERRLEGRLGTDASPSDIARRFRISSTAGAWIPTERNAGHQSLQHRRRRRRVRARGRRPTLKRRDRVGARRRSRSGRGRRRRSGSTSSTRPAPRSSRARRSWAGCSRASRASRSPTASARPARAGAIFKFFAGEAVRLARRESSTRCGRASRSKSRASRSASSRRSRRGIFRWRFRRGRSRRRSRSATCVVFKPAELVPASPWAIVDIVQRAGLPPGVLNLVMGPGVEARAGARVVAGRRRRELHRLAGRRAVGRRRRREGRRRACSSRWAARIRSSCSTTRICATAVSVAVNGAFFQAGQRCTASSRLIVTEGIHDRFVAAMVERMKKLVIDDALKPGIEIGPVVDDAAAREEPRVRRDRPEGRREARVRRRAAASARPTATTWRRRSSPRRRGAMRINREEDLRAGRGGDSREGLRRGAGGGQRHAVRAVGRAS